MKVKPIIAYAVLLKIWGVKKREYSCLEYCFSWDLKHPEEKIKKSELIMAIYPTKKQAINDANFRGECIVKRIILK